MIRRARRGAIVAIVMAVAAALSGCAGLPTDGPVNAGLPAGDDAGAPDIVFQPDKPQPGATQQQILDGFLRAGSGPTDNWATARLYLAPSFRDTWKPDAGVTIDVLADRRTVATSDTTIDVQLTPVAGVDENGAYAVGDRAPRTLSFALAQDADGDWRITEAPDGIVLDEDQFDSVYHSYPLTYFDPTWQYLVPDPRWFPTTNAATRIALALVDGAPSPWLADGIKTAFPENVSLQGPAVPVEGTLAQVALNQAALSLDPTTRNRMFTQLRESLSSAGVTDVVMTVAGTVLDADDLPVRNTRVNTLALGLTDQGFGFLSGTDIEAIEGLSATMAKVLPAPVAIQMAANRQFAAVRIGSGEVVRVQADGQVLEVDTRPDLVDPSLDPEGFVWSVPAESPSQLTAYSPQGAPVVVQDALPGASRIAAMEVSRDGSRIAAVVSVGGNSLVWVAAVVRDENGAPQRLGEPVPLATLLGAGVDIGWLDDATVGVLSRAGDKVQLLQQPVGGPGIDLTAPPSASSLAGAIIPTGVRVRDTQGALYVRRGSTWQQTGTGVLVLATQSGSPQ